METTHGKFHCAFASSCFFAYYYNPALDPLPPRRPTKAHKSSLGKLGHNAMRWRILVQRRQVCLLCNKPGLFIS